MKKIFGFAAIAILALGSFGLVGTAHATPMDDCSGPVDVACTVDQPNGAPDWNCALYVDLDSAGAPNTLDYCTVSPAG